MTIANLVSLPRSQFVLRISSFVPTLSHLALNNRDQAKSMKQKMNKVQGCKKRYEADIIVVGRGAAGCILMIQLSEGGRVRYLAWKPEQI